MYAILNDKGECAGIKIPGKFGEFQFAPIFMTRKDARLALKCLSEKSGSKVVRMSVEMRRATTGIDEK